MRWRFFNAKARPPSGLLGHSRDARPPRAAAPAAADRRSVLEDRPPFNAGAARPAAPALPPPARRWSSALSVQVHDCPCWHWCPRFRPPSARSGTPRRGSSVGDRKSRSILRRALVRAFFRGAPTGGAAAAPGVLLPAELCSLWHTSPSATSNRIFPWLMSKRRAQTTHRFPCSIKDLFQE